MYLSNQELSIPNPKKEGSLRVSFDLARVFRAESRVDEIACVTATKGPELMSVFSLALRDLSTYLAQLHFYCSVAAKKKRERRAVIVIDIMPGRLAEKKLSNNDATREAIIEMDAEYSALSEVELEIDAAYVFVREKARTVESHLNAVKKSLDSISVHVSHNPNLVQFPGASETTSISGVTVGKAIY